MCSKAPLHCRPLLFRPPGFPGGPALTYLSSLTFLCPCALTYSWPSCSGPVLIFQTRTLSVDCVTGLFCRFLSSSSLGHIVGPNTLHSYLICCTDLWTCARKSHLWTISAIPELPASPPPDLCIVDR